MVKKTDEELLTEFSNPLISKEPETTVKIKTRYNKDQIQLSTEWPDTGLLSEMNNLINKAMVDIINLKDEAVRKALINLGWTPLESYICNICQHSRGGCCSEYGDVGEDGIYDFKNRRVIKCEFFTERKDNPEHIRKPLSD